MGWWRPYFFIELERVQLLYSGFTLSSRASCVAAVFVIGLLSLADRWLAHTHAAVAAVAASHRDDTIVAIVWTAQRITGALLMLIQMSFNVVLFALTICCLGVAERWCLRTNRQAEKRRLDEVEFDG